MKRVLLAIMLVTSACWPTGGESTPVPPARSALASRPAASAGSTGLVLGGPRCLPPSPRIPSPTGVIGVLLGTAESASTTQLIAAATPLLTTDVEEKFVVRMTGDGQFDAVALDNDGVRVRPNSIVRHTGQSSFDGVFPGAEWGVLVTFPQPGCWRLHFTLSADAADIWVLVLPKS